MLCIGLASKIVVWAVSAFSLEWTHSVEKFRWAEEWQVRPDGLVLRSAHVAGSGAGIDLPEDAVRTEGGWRFKPDLPPQKSLRLAASGMTVSAWALCADGTCIQIGQESQDNLALWPCDGLEN